MAPAKITIPDGYQDWDTIDPFEDHAGPYYHKKHADGRITTAFVATPVHCNGSGYLHGGALMSFADFSLFAIAGAQLDGPAVTISFTSEFICAGHPEQLIEAQGAITRTTRSLVFVRGEVFCAKTVLMPFSGILKRIGT